jgi:hypothetical protein
VLVVAVKNERAVEGVGLDLSGSVQGLGDCES